MSNSLVKNFSVHLVTLAKLGYFKAMDKYVFIYEMIHKKDM